VGKRKKEGKRNKNTTERIERREARERKISGTKQCTSIIIIPIRLNYNSNALFIGSYQ